MLKMAMGITLALGLALCGLPVRAESAFEREAKDAYVAAFTPDGQFGGGTGATKGHEALRKMIVGLAQRNAETETKTGKKPAAMFHTSMNPYLEFVDKDHAIFRAYWTTTFAGDAPGTAARIAAVGWERNELVRLNGKWLIKVRDTAPKEKE
jgi:SnoaL-like domain